MKEKQLSPLLKKENEISISKVNRKKKRKNNIVIKSIFEMKPNQEPPPHIFNENFRLKRLLERKI